VAEPTARADADAHAAGVADEVGDDEKVGGEALLDDDAELVLDPLGVAVRRTVGEAPLQAFMTSACSQVPWS
jgi:hypothetical protein